MNRDLQDKLYDLIARKLSGDATLAELQELEALLQSAPAFQMLHDQLLQFPQLDAGVTKDITDQAYATQYVKMLYAGGSSQYPTPVVAPKAPSAGIFRLPFLKFAAVAASLFCLVLLGSTLFSDDNNHFASNGKTEHDHTKPANGKSKLTLPDGTIVYLNANSHLQYDGEFNKTSRDVVLTGEAYFDVAHNPKKPFIVHTSKAAIRVLGTRFNVKNYDGELWETTLLQGKIEMYLNDKPEDKLQLEPSQKVSIAAPAPREGKDKTRDLKISVTEIKPLEDNVVETAWMADKLVFVDKPLIDIVKDLERRFGIAVRFQSETSKQQRYTGAFDQIELKEILQILDLSNPIDYELADK